MRKRNGFTLIELIAVIAVLATIMIIAIPSLTTVISNREEEEKERKTELLISGAEIYASMYDDIYYLMVTTGCYINSKTLFESEIVSYDDYHDKNGNPIDIRIYYDKTNHKYITKEGSSTDLECLLP